jgi:microcystin-dependent protein
MFAAFRKHLVGLMSVGFIWGAQIPSASAQVDPFIGQAMLFSGSFCPQDWAPANGQLLPISRYQALFSLLGTTYGGDGRLTFGLPNAEPVTTLKSGAVFTMCIALHGVYPSRN